ncbi:MAG: ShlB/FhaC/HecB family hemolysin secretion/activation protein [Sulfuricella sp.]|nr:ShlB/FhaC/HecB family hemolysin secretion/activation protein [Sulfuricella sp.]
MARSALQWAVGGILAALAVAAHAAEDQAVVIPRFDVEQYQVEGNSLLGRELVQQILQPFTGKQRDFGDVQRAIDALEDAYRQRGYNTVQVSLPEQELERGVIRVKVTEARLAKVAVEGNQYFSTANIFASMPSLQVGDTPNIARISNNLRVANDNPAKKVSLQLQSGEREDEIIANMKVTDELAWKIGLTADNTGTQQTGATRLGLVYQYANLFDKDQVVSLQYTTSPEKSDKVGIYSLGYRIPLYELGDSIDVFAGYSDVDSGTISAGVYDLKVSGKGTVSGMRYNHNLGRAGNYDSKVIFGLDYRAYKNSVSVIDSQLGNDVTVHPFSVAYGGTWTIPAGEVGFNLTLLQNIPGGSRGGDQEFNLARAGAPVTYRILRYAANYAQVFGGDWQFRVSLTGQYTNDPLVPGEQFGVGGATTVRGFLEREVANDRGHLFNAELYTTNLAPLLGLAPLNLRALAFFDAGYVSRIAPLAGEAQSASISSAGVGLRLVHDKNLTFGIDYAYVIDAGGSQSKGDQRLHFRMGVLY